MEGWKYWEGREVYIILKNKRTYSGNVLSVDVQPILTWITLNDKFDKRITFSIEEIEVIQEEGKR